jgi:acetyltransferase-like isoleucine patch superfamily enzyme
MNEPMIFNSQIKSDVVFGSGVKIVNPVNLYGCTIGNNTFVGPFVEIQKDVLIGENCKIQSHTFICELVEIGDDCFVGHGVVFINDLFSNGGPAMGNKSFWRKTKVGKNVSIGSNATILPVEICDNVVIGAGAVVTKNIIKSGVYIGNPAKLLKKI